MRYPKHPISRDEPGGGARAESPDDHCDLTPETVPDRASGTPPPPPRRTGDPGFRPPEQPGPAAQDSWAAADSPGSWPLAARPQAEPLDSWAHEDPQLAWAAPPQDDSQDSAVPVDPQEAERAWPPSAPPDEPQEPWAEGNYRPAWPMAAPVADEPPERPMPGDREQAWSDGASPSGDAQDPWAYADPQAYRPQEAPPEAPPEGEPSEPWGYADAGDFWPAEGAGQGSSGEPWDYAGPEGAPQTEPPAQGDTREPWAYCDPEGSWDPAQAEQDWAPAAPAQADPDTGWTGPGAQQDWAPASPAQAEPPRELWRPPERPPVAPDEPWLQAPETHRRVRGWAWRKAARYLGERSQPESAAAEPPADRMPAGSEGSAEPEAATASMGFQDLWESWEPPRDPADSVSDRDVHPAAPYPEFVRDAEYEDGLWEVPAGPAAAAGSGGRGPRRAGQHARNFRQPRRGGSVFLALAAALVIAAGVPIGMLAVRTLAHHGDQTLKTAPLSASRATGSAHGAATTFSALAGPGCPAVTSATVFPYHGPNGDGWYPATAYGNGPCGSSFVFSYLAMVPGNPGEWRDDYAWVFRTGMADPSCTFSLWIPAAHEANSNVYYWFSAGDTNANDRIADFTIDQASHQGQWVTHGPFTFPGGTALIEATDRGEGPLTASAAIGPARLSC
jgi:hypothetical protein